MVPGGEGGTTVRRNRPHANTKKNGTYPLCHGTSLPNQAPGKPLSPIIEKNFWHAYFCSKEGQSDVLRDGYFPVPGALVEA